MKKIYQLDNFLPFRVPYGLIYIGGKNTDREKVNRVPYGLIYNGVPIRKPPGADRCSTIYMGEKQNYIIYRYKKKHGLFHASIFFPYLKI